MQVVEQEGEKFIVLLDSVLEECGIGDAVDISVEKNRFVLKVVVTIRKLFYGNDERSYCSGCSRT